MAIAYYGSTKLLLAVSSTGTVSFDVGSASNRYLFVFTTSDASAVTYNSVALSVLTTLTNTHGSGSTDGPSVKMWGLANPTSGTNTLAVTTTLSTGGRNDIATAIAFSGVDPTQPSSYNTYYTTDTYVTAKTISTATVVNNSWLMAGFCGWCPTGGSFSAGSSTTTRIVEPTSAGVHPGMAIMDSNAAKTPTGSYSLTANAPADTSLSTILYAVSPYLTATFTGPSSGNVNSASTNFTVTPDQAINGTITITPSGAGSSGLSPTILTFSNSAVAQTFTITPLTSGAITLTMTNGVGLYNASPLTYTANAVAPGVPNIGTATPLNTSASIAFTPPTSDGGSTITQYRATSTPGSFQNTGTSSPIVVSGLSNGTPYTFTVRATNAIGNSAESSASNSATPYVPATTFTFTGPSSGSVRSASTNFTVTPNSTYNGTITITPTGVGSTGLSPTVLTFNLSSAAQTFTITPLASGAITLTPTNSNGITNPANKTYTASAVVPLPPTMGTAEASLRSARVNISAPTNNGGATITSYTVASSPGGLTASSPTPGVITVNGLTNGVSYTFTATATNSVGTSSASSASNAVIPTSSSTSFTNNGPKMNLDRGVGNLLKL